MNRSAGVGTTPPLVCPFEQISAIEIASLIAPTWRDKQRSRKREDDREWPTKRKQMDFFYLENAEQQMSSFIENVIDQ